MVAAQVVLLLVAASPVAPMVNLVARPRFVRTFPRVGVAFGIIILLCGGTLILVALQFPSLLPWLAAASLGCDLALWWRSRSSYGSGQRWPPGSLAILPLQPWIDRWHYTKLSQVHGPIYKASHFFHPMVCLMNLESGLRLLKEQDDVRLRSPKVAAGRFLPCGFLRGMDPENHTTYRRVVQSLITPRVLAAWELSISHDVSQALSELASSPHGVYAKPVWDQLFAALLCPPVLWDYSRFARVHPAPGGASHSGPG